MPLFKFADIYVWLFTGSRCPVLDCIPSDFTFNSPSYSDKKCETMNSSILTVDGVAEVSLRVGLWLLKSSVQHLKTRLPGFLPLPLGCDKFEGEQEIRKAIESTSYDQSRKYNIISGLIDRNLISIVRNVFLHMNEQDL